MAIKILTVPLRVLILIVVVDFFITANLLLAADKQTNSLVYVSVRNTTLRTAPKFLSASALALKYGDRLDQIESGAAWIKVKSNSGKVGYVHKSAISTRRVILNASAEFTDRITGADDVVLAGKGFGIAVEKEYRNSNSAVNFREVDLMERQRVSIAELAAFIKAGQLDSKG